MTGVCTAGVLTTEVGTPGVGRPSVGTPGVAGGVATPELTTRADYCSVAIASQPSAWSDNTCQYDYKGAITLSVLDANQEVPFPDGEFLPADASTHGHFKSIRSIIRSGNNIQGNEAGAFGSTTTGWLVVVRGQARGRPCQGMKYHINRVAVALVS